jgi:riboflavin synthase
MFTGLIETVGTIKELKWRGNYRILSITGSFANDKPAPGESISCDGACLTVVSIDKGTFDVEASQETTGRTILNSYTVGSRINLERALKAGSRLGGHFVSGHVDDTGVVDYIRPVGRSLELAVRFDPHFDKLVIDKGSIAINGVSLTVNACRPGWFNVNLIPFTVKETTLGLLQSGHRVNLEFDMIGKYVLKIQENRTRNALTREKLIESGW